MSLFDTIHSAYSGLSSASAGLSTTSHNVANANTEGYTRRTQDSSTSDPLQQGGLFIGQGVDTNAILRNVDTVLAGNTLEAAGLASEAEAEHDALSAVESLFVDDLATTSSDALSAFYDALTDATSDPADDALRLAVAFAGEALADSLADTASSLADAQQDLGDQMEAMGGELNALLEEAASLNEALTTAGGALSAGDIADQLDVVLRDLADNYGMTVDYQADGSATVLMGNQAVVTGGEAREVSISQDSAGVISIGVAAGGGSIDITEQAAGTLGGLLAAQEHLADYQAQLDDIAVGLADALNAQHQAGYDAAGNPGGDLFSYDPTDPAATLSFDDGIVEDPSLLAFAADPTAEAGDGGNLDALLATEDSALVGSQTAGEALSSLSSQVGFDVQEAAGNADSERAAADDLDALQQQLYGVDLDEEATDLITYQAAYEAAAKVLQAADQMLGTLLDLV